MSYSERTRDMVGKRQGDRVRQDDCLNTWDVAVNTLSNHSEKHKYTEEQLLSVLCTRVFMCVYE